MNELLKKKLLLDLQSDVEDIRKDACRMLAQEGDHSVLDILRAISSKDTVAIRYFARKAVDAIIKRCGPPEKRLEIDFDQILKIDEESGKKDLDADKFLSLLEHSDQAIRLETIKKCTEIASEVGSQEMLPVLTERLSKPNDPVERSLLVKAVGTFGTKEHISDLIPFLSDNDPRVRADTIEALEYIGDSSVYPAIVPLLQDGDNRVQANAAVALKHFGESQSLQLLEKMLESREVWMRDSAAYALREIKTAQTVKLLIEVLKRETKYGVYAKASESLSRAGSRSDIPMIKTLLQLEEDKRKREMLIALVHSLQGQLIDFSQFIPGRNTRDQSISVSVTSTDVIGAIDKVADALQPIAEGRKPTRSHGSLGEPAVATIDFSSMISNLIHDLSNPDEEVRKQAAIKLEKIDDVRAIPALEKAATDSDNVVRYYAKKALRAMQSRGIQTGKKKKPWSKLDLITIPFKYSATGVLLLFVLVSVIWTVFSMTASEEQVLEAKEKITSSFERLVTSYERYKGVGEQVTWSGIVRDVDPVARVLILRSHTYVFSTTIPPDDPGQYTRGDIVEINGTLKDRSLFGAVELEADSIRVTELNKAAHEKRTQQGKVSCQNKIENDTER